MVTLNKLVEISCLDFITDNSKGAIKKMSKKLEQFGMKFKRNVAFKIK